RLVRAASRMAARLRAEWIVAHVETTSQPPLSLEERESLVSTLKLAERLGATTTVLSRDSVSAALLEFARERHVSTVVARKPAHARSRDRLRGALRDEIVRDSGEVDVYFTSGDGDDKAAAPRPQPGRRSPASAYARALPVVTLCTLVCWAMSGRFD